MEQKDSNEKDDSSFKKPILIGKIGRLPKKLEQKNLNIVPEKKPVESTSLLAVQSDNVSPEDRGLKSPTQQLAENSVPYKEPIWSGLPQSVTKKYGFEVLKNGAIIENISLMEKPFWIFGRMTNCSICMQHPTISRYHAVLQYRKEGSEDEPAGFYIYDLGSTHGTFLNKKQIKSKIYVRVQVGHMLRLGCSQRSYILSGPDEDAEEESELTVTELKEKRAEDIRKREEEERETLLRIEREKEERRKKEEERGVDWGLGDDSEDEQPEDFSENPYAQTNNEELYLDDPKKALRGFFEREGLELEYDCSEHSMGQFLCKVELPIDDDMGRPIIAEVLHKGKKKEAVVQCALEACRILDRYGMLRQATHESRKRKAKNWEENDYYDSDEDTFLDRTGTVEKKRQMRMNSKIPQKAETYENLLEKEKKISSEIADLEKQLLEYQSKQNNEHNMNTDADSLDVFMKELKHSKPDKKAASKIKLDLIQLKKEHASVLKLVNIAKPSSLPALVPQYANLPSTSKETKATFPMIGKRRKINIQLPPKPVDKEPAPSLDEEEEENEEELKEEEGEVERKEGVSISTQSQTETNREVKEMTEKARETEIPDTVNQDEVEDEEEELSRSSNSSDDDIEMHPTSIAEFRPIKSFHETLTFKKFEQILKKGLPALFEKHQEKLEKILNKLKKLAANEDRMHVDWKILSAKKRKVMKLISDLRTCEPNEKLEHKVSAELNRILSELNLMTEEKCKVIGKVKKMGDEIKTISEAIGKEFQEFRKEISKNTEDQPSSSKVEPEEVENAETLENDEKRKKKNYRRIQQRQEKAEIERQRGYEEDAQRDDYNMWVPPSDQLGDGKTSLNDKYGY